MLVEMVMKTTLNIMEMSTACMQLATAHRSQKMPERAPVGRTETLSNC